MTSLTIDLDFGEKEKFKKNNIKRVKRICRKIMKHFGISPKIHITRKGYHILVNHLPISFQETLVWRYRLGDDIKRIQFDMESKFKPKGILFTRKDDFKVREIEYGDLCKMEGIN